MNLISPDITGNSSEFISTFISSCFLRICPDKDTLKLKSKTTRPFTSTSMRKSLPSPLPMSEAEIIKGWTEIISLKF